MQFNLAHFRLISSMWPGMPVIRANMAYKLSKLNDLILAKKKSLLGIWKKVVKTFDFDFRPPITAVYEIPLPPYWKWRLSNKVRFLSYCMLLTRDINNCLWMYSLAKWTAAWKLRSRFMIIFPISLFWALCTLIFYILWFHNW